MKPILFNTDMVRAILEGRKTVTRRVVRTDAVNRIVEDENGKCVGSYSLYHPEWDVYPTVDDAPYQPGDILYVRERVAYLFGRYVYRADYDEVTEESKQLWKPSIRMPREAARIFLRVTDVRVERLQDITAQGSLDEGVKLSLHGILDGEPTTAQFGRVWDSTVKPIDRNKYGWDANPWVWVIEFERISKKEANSVA